MTSEKQTQNPNLPHPNPVQAIFERVAAREQCRGCRGCGSLLYQAEKFCPSCGHKQPEPMGMKTTTETWVVEYSEHDCGSRSGHLIRKSEKDAQRTARLLKECGYAKVTFRQYTK